MEEENLRVLNKFLNVASRTKKNLAQSVDSEKVNC